MSTSPGPDSTIAGPKLFEPRGSSWFAVHVQPLHEPALKDVTEGIRVATSGPGGAAGRGGEEVGRGGAGRGGACEARGLGGGLGTRFLYWDTISYMNIKRSTTKNLRPSPNPSSASNADAGLDCRQGACRARFLLETRARPDFLLGIDQTHENHSI